VPRSALIAARRCVIIIIPRHCELRGYFSLASLRAPWLFFPRVIASAVVIFLPVIASARAAGREAIQKKHRGLVINPQAWIAARLAAARNDAGYEFGFHGVK